MRAAFFLLTSALATLATAQFDGLPTCATACVLQYTSGNTIAGCDKLSVDCICSNTSFLDSIACCLASGCSLDDQGKVVKFSQDLCTANGVTNLPTAVVCNAANNHTTTPSSTASKTASSTASSTASPTAAGAVSTRPGLCAAGLIGGLAAIVAML